MLPLESNILAFKTLRRLWANTEVGFAKSG